ncbi:HAD family hydrolase [Coxiella burnetii]|uniref:HAD family hydrolase n=1 Tax=Coxiella burnetii TaxID=777 RepID=UPI0000DAEC70|nr:HAD family hydrolase [Coxiella burnetii]ATN82245.1 HAD family hydrolase [Coxiella burnetii]ATN84146.1 HAD family hydrolase [Coxiella burnetii]POZ78622.1 HAD family hydrolase [Coxiella burnetii]
MSTDGFIAVASIDLDMVYWPVAYLLICKMKDVKYLLFDLDGTLTDPKEGITRSVQYALEQMNVACPSMDELEWTIGPPLIDAFALLLNTKDKKQLQKAINFYRERYVDRCAIENKPYDGIHETLETLVNHGYQLYLATSKPWAYAGKILDHFNLRDYFTAVHGSELDGTRDYKEELIGYVLDTQKISNTQSLMIGDRRYDILGAKHNNVRSIGVTYGYGSLEEIQEAGPDAVCDHHRLILTTLNK